MKSPKTLLLKSKVLILGDGTGQAMVEYVMMIVLVGLAAFILSPNIRDSVLKVFQSTSSVLK